VKIFVDENILLLTVHYLIDAGHDVADIRKTPMEGVNDEAVWKLAQKQKRLLITTDKGFVTHRQEKHFGVLVVLLRRPNRIKLHEKIVQRCNNFKSGSGPERL